MSTANVVSKIDEVAKEFGFTLKEKQKEVICAFISGNDVFCCLPTGYGKSLCYSILPKVYVRIRNVKRLSIVLCVSALVALMMEQKKNLLRMGYLLSLYLKVIVILKEFEASRKVPGS